MELVEELHVGDIAAASENIFCSAKNSFPERLVALVLGETRSIDVTARRQLSTVSFVHIAYRLLLVIFPEYRRGRADCHARRASIRHAGADRAICLSILARYFLASRLILERRLALQLLRLDLPGLLRL